jgi:hypothetical protein
MEVRKIKIYNEQEGTSENNFGSNYVKSTIINLTNRRGAL